jgi:hypothetical protein
VRYPAFVANCSKVWIKVSLFEMGESCKRHVAQVAAGRSRNSLASSGCVLNGIMFPVERIAILSACAILSYSNR